MDLTQTELAAALADAGLFTFPRKVGNPGQIVAGNPTGFYRWWTKNHGVNGVGQDGVSHPMFIGHSGIVPPDRNSPAALRTDAKEYVFETAFGDFDTGDNSGLRPDEVWDEVQRVSRFLVENRLDHYWKYSGSDCGFHLHVFFEPERAPRHYLERWESAFWRGLKNELSVRSINIRCANPVCMERIPYTRYVHKKDPNRPGQYVAESNYCVPVPWDLVHDGKLETIRSLSKYPEAYPTVRYEGGLPRPRLEALVRRKGWETFGHVVSALHPEPAFEPRGEMAILLKELAPDRRCIQVLSFGSNPRHDVRVALLCELTSLGMGFEEVYGHICAIGKEARWEDYNPEKIRSYVLPAVRKGYSAVSCHALREKGVCLGPSCRLFRDQFPREWAEHLKTHPVVD